MLDAGSVEVTGTNFDINGGAIDGTTIGGSAAAAATVTNLTASGTINFNGATVSDLGTISTVDINGGTIDGAAIGGSTANLVHLQLVMELQVYQVDSLLV